MTVPHPFRTIRRAGSPSAGGNAHTLAQHIGSQSAHPIYMKKGDQVGGVDITAHMGDKDAHYVYYLRRDELTTSTDSYFNNVNISFSSFDGSDVALLNTAHPVVISAPLLYQLLTANSARALQVIPSMMQFTNIVTAYMSTKADKIGSTLTNVTGDKHIPSWSLFAELYELVHSFLTKDIALNTRTESIVGNPLSAIFARADHTHSETYALVNHIHTFEDIVVSDDDDTHPARADHNHDGVYWRKDEDISAEASLAPLTQVGIYPISLRYNYPDELNLDYRTIQGCSTYTINDGNVDQYVGLPEEFVSAISKQATGADSKFTSTGDLSDTRESASNLSYTAVLKVSKSVGENIDFEDINLTDYIGVSPTKTHVDQLVSQILVTNAAVADLVRSSAGSQNLVNAVKEYKNELDGLYWRIGNSFETAWFIRTVVYGILRKNESYINSIDAEDTLKAYADIADEVFSVFDSGGETYSLPNGISIGIYSPSVTDKVRADIRLWLVGNGSADNGVQVNVPDSVIQGEAVLHDVTKWTSPHSVIFGGAYTNSGNASSFHEFQKYNIFRNHTELLPYLTYYVNNTSYTAVSLSANVVVAKKYCEYDTATNSYNDLTLNISDLTTETTPDVSGGSVYIDPIGCVLHEYRSLASGAGTYESGKKYYTLSSAIDAAGNSTFTENTSATDGGSYANGSDVYIRVAILSDMTDAPQWSKKSVIPGTTDYIEGLTYYYYDTTQHKFITFSNPESLNNDVTGKIRTRAEYIAAGYTGDNYPKAIYVDYQIYEKRETLDKVIANSTRNSVIPVGTLFTPEYEYVKYPTPGTYTTSIPVSVASAVEVEDVDGLREDRQYFVKKNGVINPTPKSYAELVVTGFESGATYYSTRINTSDKEYVVAGMLVPSANTYGIVIPVYNKKNEDGTYAVDAYEQIGSTSRPIYCKAFFYRTKDETLVPNKRYYYVKSDGTYERYAGTTVPETLTLYEIIDQETLFDIAKAIDQLVTVGSSQSVTSSGVKYTFGQDGELIHWDEWCRAVSNHDTGYSNAVINTHGHGNKSVLDLFTYNQTEGQLYFNGNKITTSSSNHSHGNKTNVLDKLTTVTETSGSATITRLKFDTYSIAYKEDISAFTDLLTSARTGLEMVSKFSSDVDGNVLVNGEALLYAKDVHVFANESVLDQITQSVITNSHIHTNKSDILDMLSKSSTGGLMFNGNEIGAFAATYELKVFEGLTISQAKALTVWEQSVNQVNTSLGKSVFASISALEACQFQFKLVAKQGTTVLAEKDPIVIFEDDDDSHLSVGFKVSESKIYVVLPTKDYLASFGGTKGSVTTWESSHAGVTFDLILTVVRPGTLGTGDGQYFDNYAVLQKLSANAAQDLFYNSKKLLFVDNLDTETNSLGYVKSSAFASTMGLVAKPSNWNDLLNLSTKTGSSSLFYMNEALAFAKDVPSDFGNRTLLSSLSVNTDGRLTYTSGSSTKALMNRAEFDTWLTNTYNSLSSSVATLVGYDWLTRVLETSETDKTKRTLKYNSKKIFREGDLPVAEVLTSQWVHTEVNKTKVPTPDGNETYYVASGSNYVLATNNGHPTAWDASTAYFVRTADVRVNGSKISGVGSGDGGDADAVTVIDKTVSTDTASNFTIGSTTVPVWGFIDSTDTLLEGSEITEFEYDVYLKVTASTKVYIISNPMVNISESEDYAPIYVPAKSLIVLNTDTGIAGMKVPTSWLDVTGALSDTTNIVEIHVRMTKIVNKE